MMGATAQDRPRGADPRGEQHMETLLVGQDGAVDREREVRDEPAWLVEARERRRALACESVDEKLGRFRRRLIRSYPYGNQHCPQLIALLAEVDRIALALERLR